MRFSLLLMVLLTSCSSVTPNLIVAPQLFLPTSNELQHGRLAFEVVDNREGERSLTIKKSDISKPFKASNDIRAHIEQTLNKALEAKGAQINVNAANKMMISIDKLRADVEQGTLEHNVTNQVAIRLSIQHPGGTFSKTYSGNSSYKAPFQMDIAAVERELRLLTEQVLTKMLQDNAWYGTVRG